MKLERPWQTVQVRKAKQEHFEQVEARHYDMLLHDGWRIDTPADLPGHNGVSSHSIPSSVRVSSKEAALLDARLSQLEQKVAMEVRL